MIGKQTGTAGCMSILGRVPPTPGPAPQGAGSRCRKNSVLRRGAPQNTIFPVNTLRLICQPDLYFPERYKTVTSLPYLRKRHEV
jgi:hypothetical protein